jgi:hypothetical protein
MAFHSMERPAARINWPWSTLGVFTDGICVEEVFKTMQA